MNGPLSKQRCVSLLVVVSLLSVDPRHTENHFLLVDPLQAREYAAVDHTNQPVAHTLRSVCVWQFHKWFGGIVVDGGCVVGEDVMVTV